MSAEKENVFRTLREEELLVTFWGCKFGLHKWTKYREPEKVQENYDLFIIQQRRCGSCNVANRKIVRKA